MSSTGIIRELLEELIYLIYIKVYVPIISSLLNMIRHHHRRDFDGEDDDDDFDDNDDGDDDNDYDDVVVVVNFSIQFCIEHDIKKFIKS